MGAWAGWARGGMGSGLGVIRGSAFAVPPSPASLARPANAARPGSAYLRFRPRRLKARNAPPPSKAIRAASHGHDQPFASGASAVPICTTGSTGCGAGSVLTSEGSDGVIGAPLPATAGRLPEAGVTALGGAATIRFWLAARAAGWAASEGTASPCRAGAGAVDTGWVVDAGGRSAGRVTVPSRLKSRSCDGPTVSAEGGGAAVTSIGASLFWANAGRAMPSDSAAAVPPKIFKVMRRNAVILPPCCCWMSQPAYPQADACWRYCLLNRANTSICGLT